MGILAIDATTIFNYFLKEDLGEPKTVFRLKLLDVRELSYAKGEYRRRIEVDEGGNVKDLDARTRADLLDLAMWTVRLSIVGWENFTLQNGEDAVFETESIDLTGIGKRVTVKESCIRRYFTTERITEIANAVLNTSKLTAAQLKN